MFWGFIHRNRFKKINSFCLFIGYPRTGHSLVCALLDAHPNIVISMEWNVLHYFIKGYKKYQIFWSIVKNSQNFREKTNSILTGYSYKVDGLSQGHSNKILVIGDKMAGTTSGTILHNPSILDKFENALGTKIKMIHIIRNPFDTITTMAIRILARKYPDEKPDYLNLLPCIKRFFNYASIIQRIKNDNKFDLIDIYHEDVISDPQKALKQLTKYLSIEATNQYYFSCSKIVYNQPNKSRYQIKWPKELINFVEGETIKFIFLKHYKYDN